MFDSLKDKLNSFRKDVEETAEEKAAEAEAEAEAEADPDAPTEADSDPAAAETESGVEAPASTGADTETGRDDPSTDDAAATEAPAADAESAEAASAPSEPAPAPDAESEDGGDAGADADATAEADADADADADAVETPTPRPTPGGTDTDTDDAAEPEEDRAEPGRLRRAAAFATGKIIIEEEDLEEPLWQLEMALLESDVEMNVAEAILDTIREKMVGETRKQVDTTAELVEEALHDALLDVISVGQFDFDQRIAEADKPVTIIFTGVNGVGKTTTIAKMSEYLESRGLSTVLANGDTYRAGANEQIRKHADNLDRELIAHEQGGDPAAVIYDAVEYAEAHDVDVVLGDTAGRLHTSNDLMAQLEKINRVVDPDTTLFVDEAVAGQDAVQRSQKFDDVAEIDGTVLTKADADSKGGAAISIAYVTGKPILFLGTGQGYGDLEPFDPEEMVARLLGEDEDEG